MKIFLITLLVGLTSRISKAQLSMNTIPQTREIVLNSGDTIQKLHIFITNPNFKTKTRCFYSWYQNQRVLHTQGAWSGKLLEGQYEAFYPNHNLLEQGTYHRGYQVGTWKKWYPDGTLQEEMRWKHGLRHGQYQRFDATGQLIEKGIYCRDQLHGMQIIHVNGELTKVCYKKGELMVKKEPSNEKKQPQKRNSPTNKAAKKPQKTPEKKPKKQALPFSGNR